MNRFTIASNVLLTQWKEYLNGSDFNSVIDKETGAKLFNMKTSSNYQEAMDGYSGFGAAPTKKEEDNIYETSLTPLRDILVRHKTYAIGVPVSLEAIEDDRNGIFNGNCVKELGASCMAAAEYARASLIENGFSPSYTQASGPTYGDMGGGTDNGDGQPLFSATHTYANGVSWSNLASGNPTFSISAYANARARIKGQRNLGGIFPAVNKIKRIFYHPNSWLNIEQAFKSQKEPTTGNNAINPVNTEGVELVEWELLDTYTAAWYLQCEKHYLDFFWRLKPTAMEPYRKQNGDMFFSIRERFSLAWFAAQGMYASTGAQS